MLLTTEFSGFVPDSTARHWRALVFLGVGFLLERELTTRSNQFAHGASLRQNLATFKDRHTTPSQLTRRAVFGAGLSRMRKPPARREFVQRAEIREVVVARPHQRHVIRLERAYPIVRRITNAFYASENGCKVPAHG